MLRVMAPLTHWTEVQCEQANGYEMPGTQPQCKYVSDETSGGWQNKTAVNAVKSEIEEEYRTTEKIPLLANLSPEDKGRC